MKNTYQIEITYQRAKLVDIAKNFLALFFASALIYQSTYACQLSDWFDGISVPFSKSELDKTYYSMRNAFLASMPNTAIRKEAHTHLRGGIEYVRNSVPFFFRHMNLLGTLYTFGIISFEDFQIIRGGGTLSPERAQYILERLRWAVNHASSLQEWAQNAALTFKNYLVGQTTDITQPVFEKGYIFSHDLHTSDISRVQHGMLSRFHTVNSIAIKIFSWGTPTDPDTIRLFDYFSKNEAIAGHVLFHPDVVAPFGFIRFNHQDVFFMPYIRSQQSLWEIMPKRSPQALFHLFVKASRIVHTCLQRGVMNLDIKPANFLVDATDHVYFIDFGFSFFRDIAPGNYAGITRHYWIPQDMGTRLPFDPKTEIIYGTFPYTPPEVQRGGLSQWSEAGQVFSLGVMMYAMITRNQFKSIFSYYGMKLAVNDAPDLAALARVHPDLEAIYLKATNWDNPEARYATVGEFLEALERVAPSIE